MTDIQVKYQTLQESKRHNAEMEKLGLAEADIKRESNVIASQKNRIEEVKVASSAVTGAIDTGLKAGMALIGLM